MNICFVLVFLFILVAVILGFTFLNLPGSTLFWTALQNSGHALAFASLSTIALHILAKSEARLNVWAIACIVIALSAAGLVIELAQKSTGRGASLSDLAFNTTGIVCGICLYLFFATEEIFKKSQAIKIGLLFAGVSALVWSLHWPIVFTIAGTQKPIIPILADFENFGAEYFIRGTGSTRVVAHHSEWRENTSRSVRVQFLKGPYPNIQFLEPEKNWSDYSSFSFKVFNPTLRSISIYVRVDDASLGRHSEDHMTIQQVVPAGDFEVEIDLDIFRADTRQRGRSEYVKFQEIDTYIIFVKQADLNNTLYFDDFLLQ